MTYMCCRIWLIERILKFWRKNGVFENFWIGGWSVGLFLFNVNDDACFIGHCLVIDPQLFGWTIAGNDRGFPATVRRDCWIGVRSSEKSVNLKYFGGEMSFWEQFASIFLMAVCGLIALAMIVILFMMAPWFGAGLVAVALICVLITVWVRRH